MYVLEMTSRMISEDVLANKTLSVYERNRENVRDYYCYGEGFARQLREYLKSPEAMPDQSWLSSYLDLLTVEMVENGLPENPFDKIIKVFITKLSLISLQYSIKLHVRQHS